MKTFKLTLLFWLLTVLTVLIGGSVGGETGMVFAFFFAAALNFFSYWFADTIVLKMYRAQEIGPLERPVFYHTVQRRTWRACGGITHD
jgi:heat shock protein HtpX